MILTNQQADQVLSMPSKSDEDHQPISFHPCQNVRDMIPCLSSDKYGKLWSMLEALTLTRSQQVQEAGSSEVKKKKSYFLSQWQICWHYRLIKRVCIIWNFFTWSACTASIHCVLSNSDDRKNVYTLEVRFPTRKTRLGEANTNCASKSASFFLCFSDLDDLRCLSTPTALSSHKSWSRTVDAALFRATIFGGQLSRGSTPGSSNITISDNDIYHFNSNVNLSLPDAWWDNKSRNISNQTHLKSKSIVYWLMVFTLYLAQAITSLKRNKCLSFLWPSASSTMKELRTSLLWALSAAGNIAFVRIMLNSSKKLCVISKASDSVLWSGCETGVYFRRSCRTAKIV